VTGTAVQIADEMEAWFRGRAVDGFLVQPPVLPVGLDDFVEQVIPELQNRGLFRTEYEGATLRENLGLPRPVNQHVL
jgi:N-acetyl-S-(2-succino)cysteine monooxygenase